MLVNSINFSHRREGSMKDPYTVEIIKFTKRTGLTYEYINSMLSGDKLYVNNTLVCQSPINCDETYKIFCSFVGGKSSSRLNSWMWKSRIASYVAKNKCKRSKAIEEISSIEDAIYIANLYM